MKRKLLLLILVFASFQGMCGIQGDDFGVHQETTHYDSCRICTSSKFYRVLKEYIGEYRMSHGDTKFFYSIYFFHRDSVDYFTIWVSLLNPESVFVKKNNYDYYLFNDFEKIDQFNNYIVLVTDHNVLLPKILGSCNEYIRKITLQEVPEIITVATNDGSTFPETYRYYSQNGEYFIQEQDEPIIDFYEELLIRFEEYKKKYYQRKGMKKKKSKIDF
ncbi:hypothetical protein LJB94_00955 [Odoribacter sp. OttesenSCG-928-G04]|nr:hypothetical protein [Odoribacter sp. OttesenSCG-928-G04]